MAFTNVVLAVLGVMFVTLPSWGAQKPNVIVIFNGAYSCGEATETLPALKDGRAPQAFEELWAGFDPCKEPLDVDEDKIGVYGHAMGAELTIAVAGSDARVKAAAPSCGGITDKTSEHPLSNMSAHKKISCPILFLNASNDFHGRIHDLPPGRRATPNQGLACR